MAENSFRVEFTGGKEDNGQIRLLDLVLELTAIQDTLKHLDHLVSRSQKTSMYVIIKKLSYASPLRFEFDIKPIKASQNYTVTMVDKFFTGLDRISTGRDPKNFDRATIESFQEIGSGFKKNIRRIAFYNTKMAVTLTDNLDECVKKVLGKNEFVQGFVSGILEAINIHGKRNRFNIYPIAGAEKIECRFPKGLFEKAISGLGHKVNVCGRIMYRGREKFPHSIDADDMEIFPNDDELPSFMDLEGIAPNATGDLTSEEFVRKIRDAT